MALRQRQRLSRPVHSRQDLQQVACGAAPGLCHPHLQSLAQPRLREKRAYRADEHPRHAHRHQSCQARLRAVLALGYAESRTLSAAGRGDRTLAHRGRHRTGDDAPETGGRGTQETRRGHQPSQQPWQHRPHGCVHHRREAQDQRAQRLGALCRGDSSGPADSRPAGPLRTTHQGLRRGQLSPLMERQSQRP